MFSFKTYDHFKGGKIILRIALRSLSLKSEQLVLLFIGKDGHNSKNQ